MTFVKDKVTWITGASSGIGRALAEELAKKGAKLILSSRNREALEAVYKTCGLTEKTGLILPFDQETEKDYNKHAALAIKQFGKIDILIINGGISQRSLAAETPLEIDRKVMEINFFSSVALTKSVLPSMISQKRGHIVVMSSISGKFGYFFRSAYSASKHALHGFFESLRMEIEKENVQITLVCPGKIKTNISLNAVTKDGGKHNIMDKSQAEGMDANACAKKIIVGIENNKQEIFIGGKEMNALWVKRFFPGLFSKLIRKIKPE